MNEQEDEGTGAVELLPCPFCGGKGEVRPIRYGASGYPLKPITGYEVMCGGCGTSNVEGEHDTKAGAIAAWNTRHTPDVVQAVEAERARIVAALNGLITEYIKSPGIGLSDTLTAKMALEEAIAIAREEG